MDIAYDPTSIDLEHIAVFNLKMMGFVPPLGMCNRWGLFSALCAWAPWAEYLRKVGRRMGCVDGISLVDLYWTLVEESPRLGLMIDTVYGAIVAGRWDHYVLA